MSRRDILGRIIVLIGLATIPLVYAGLLSSANQDPTHHLDHVPAAIVNEDRPDGDVHLGKDLTDELVSSDDPQNFDWRTMSAAEADAALRSGEIYAVLRIPSDFSANASSIKDTDPATAKQALLEITTNDASNMISGTIASTAGTEIADTLAREVSQTYLENIYASFTDLGQQLDTAADGADDLSDGTSSAKEGSDTLVVGMQDLHDGTVQLSTGAHDLATGADDLSSGAGTLADGAQRVNQGAIQLRNGLGSASDASHELATGLSTLDEKTSQLPESARELAGGAKALKNGSAELRSGARDLATGIDDLSAGASDLNEGAKALTSGLTDAKTGAKDLADGSRRVDESVQPLATGADTAAGGVEQVSGGLSDLSQNWDAMSEEQRKAAVDELAEGASTAAAGSRELADKTAQLADGTQSLRTGAQNLHEGLTSASDGVQALADGAGELHNGAEEAKRGAGALRDGLAPLADGAATLDESMAALVNASDELAGAVHQASSGSQQLDKGLTKLHDGSGDLTRGTGQLAEGSRAVSTGAGALSDGAGRLADGADDAAAGTRRAEDGAQDLSDGLGELKNGSQELADGLHDGADEVPRVSDQGATDLADVAAVPVGVEKSRWNEVAGYGSGLAPYFMGLALWVGALGFFLMMPPLAVKWVRSKHSAVVAAIVSYAPAAAMALVQSVLMLLTVRFAVGIEFEHLGRAFVVALAVSLAFFAINQALVSLLGPPGRYLALILIVLQLSSAGGTYPVETAPGFFQAVHHVLPMTYAVQAFRSAVAGSDLGFSTALWVSGGYVVAGIALTAVAVVIQRRRVPRTITGRAGKRAAQREKEPAQA